MTDAIHYPQAQPVNPFAALYHMGRIIKNKEDTSQVFHVIRNISGKSVWSAYEEFCRSEYGRDVIPDPGRPLRDLIDRQRLRDLPPGTFGRVYADFMDAENLDTNGVYEAAEEAGFGLSKLAVENPAYYAFRFVIMLTHDLYHILTGYGRDGLGEAALLAFTHQQHGERGAAFIAFFAGLKVRSERFDIPVGRIMAEGRALGAQSARLLCTDLTAMMDRPLEDVRRALNIGEPVLYKSIPKDVLDSLVLPQAA